jgi:hypothetical protein
MNIETRLKAENIATFKAPDAEIPKKTLPTFRTHTFNRSLPGNRICAPLIKNTTIVNKAWQHMINGTDLNEKIVRIILLKITIENEDAM